MIQNHKLLVVTLVLVASVIATPFVYAIVEPHILIMMDAGQTTKPLQIKDNFGQEVFSVDVDGTIFPAPTVPPAPAQEDPRFESFIFFSAPERQFTSILTPVKIDTWRIDLDSSSPPPNTIARIFMEYQFSSAEIHTDGTSFASFTFDTSLDDISYTQTLSSYGNQNAVYQTESFAQTSREQLCVGVTFGTSCFISIFIDHDQVGSGDTFMKDLRFELFFFVAEGELTITKVFP